MGSNLQTRNGHNMFTMASLLQKAIRRGDKVRAGYAAMELFGTYHGVLWNRIMTVACEDSWGILSKELVVLRYLDDEANKGKQGYEKDTQYVAKAVSFLCDAKKSRDACYYACNFVLQTYVVDPGVLKREFVTRTREEAYSIKQNAFEIREISGEVIKVVKGAAKPDPSYNQMSLFQLQTATGTEYIHIGQGNIPEEKKDLYIAYLRKGIRTLDMELSGYAVFHLRQMDMDSIWRVLYVMAMEECEGIPVREIVALRHCDTYVNRNKPLDKRDEIYICKGIMILMYCISGEYESILGNSIIDPEYLVNWQGRSYIDIRGCDLPDGIVPEWVYDVHTIKGKKAGHTDFEMNLVEQAALNPLQIAFFDEGNWKPRYEYKHKHGLCTEKEYTDMLEYSKTREDNPVKKIKDRFK